MDTATVDSDSELCQCVARIQLGPQLCDFVSAHRDAVDSDDENDGESDDIPENPFFNTIAGRKGFYAALNAFNNVYPFIKLNISDARYQNFCDLPEEHQNFLVSPPISYLHSLDDLTTALCDNSKIAEAIYKRGTGRVASMFPTQESGPDSEMMCQQRIMNEKPWQSEDEESRLFKAFNVVAALVRDWSVEASQEREACYKPIFASLEESLRKGARILVPGAGGCRLMFELAMKGYNVTGNEDNYSQLLAGDWILNEPMQPGQYTLHPWVWQPNNNFNQADVLHGVAIPDIVPSTAVAKASEAARANGHQPGAMTMAAGDFEYMAYAGQVDFNFDAIVSLFFIDTTSNFLRYVDAAKRMLKKGGLWVNVGPLCWPTCVLPLSNEQVLMVLEKRGFEILTSDNFTGYEMGYQANDRTMRMWRYRPAHWVAKML